MQATVSEAFRRDLLAQAAGIEERRRRERAAKLEEGTRLAAAAAAERAHLAEVKARKLAEMDAAGVPAKYKSDLERLQPGAARKFAK